MKTKKKQVKKQTKNLARSFSKKSGECLKISPSILVGISITIGLFIIVLMVIASFFDWQIDYGLSSWSLSHKKIDSITINSGEDPLGKIGFIYSHSVFATIVEILGTLPLPIFGAFAMGVFFWNAKRIPTLWGSVPVQLILFALATYEYTFSFYGLIIPNILICSLGVEQYALIPHLSKVCTVIPAAFFGIGLTGLQFWALKAIDPTTIRQMVRWAVIFTLTAVITFALIEILKKQCPRERFRYIYAFQNVEQIIYNGQTYTGEDFSNYFYGGFVNWYKLPGSMHLTDVARTISISHDAVQSFPSGHTGLASVGFMSMILAPFIVRNWNTKNIKICFFLFGSLGVIAVAMGRMVAGAHFLSDVTVGGSFPLVFYVVFYWAFSYRCKWMDHWCDDKPIYNISNKKK